MRGKRGGGEGGRRREGKGGRRRGRRGEGELGVNREKGKGRERGEVEVLEEKRRRRVKRALILYPQLLFVCSITEV